MLKRLLPAMLLGVVLLPTQAQAHFPWLVLNRAEGRVDVYFAESADPDDPALLDRLGELTIRHRAVDGKTAKQKAVRQDDWLGLPAKSFDGTYALAHEYGVITRGDSTFLLQYAAKAYAGPKPAGEFGKPVAALDLVPEWTPGRLTLVAHWNGKPLADAEVTVDTPDLDRVTGQTDAKGRFTVESKSEGLFAARVKHVEAKPGKRGDKAYTDARHYTTLTVEIGESTGKTAAKTPSESSTSALPDLPRGLTSFGAAVLGDTVYVYGGHTGEAHDYYRESQSNQLLALDLSDPKGWTVAAKGPRRQGLALVAHGKHLYRVGGFEARNKEGENHVLVSTADFARFDPKTGKWEKLADLPEPRSSHDAVVIGDHLYVAGGWAMDGLESKWHSTAYVADLSADEIAWKKLPEPPFKRRAMSLGESDGRLVVIGGMEEEGGTTTKVSVYDPKSKKWSEGPSINAKGRMGGFGSSAFLCGDNLYATTYEGTVQRLDRNAGKWETVGKVEHPRFFHRMLALSGDRLLLVGGGSMAGKVLEVETFDVSDDK